MTETEKKEYKRAQFQHQVDQMSTQLNTIGLLPDDKQVILTYYTWICFDHVLKQQMKKVSSHLQNQFKPHIDSFNAALTTGLSHIKPTISQKEKALLLQHEIQNLLQNQHD